MATVVRNLAQFENGTCRWSYSYDDAQFKLLTFDCVNETDFATYGVLTALSDGTTVPVEVAPHAELHQNIPSAVSNKFLIGVDARGRLTGVDHAFGMGPLPPGR